MSKEVEEIVDLLDKYGFNPIKIIGNLYLVRAHSKRYVEDSFYLPKIIKKPLDKNESI